MSDSTEDVPVLALPDLIPRLRRVDAFAAVVRALQRGDSGTIDGAWGSSSALATAALAAALPRTADAGETLLVVTPRISDVDDVVADLASYFEEPPEVFPAWETLPQEQSVSDPIFGARLQLLNDVESGHAPRVVVASLPALLQPVPDAAERKLGTRRLVVGESLDLEEFLKWLVDRGFERQSALERPGEFSVHGGILDVFSPGSAEPIRVELFGDDIESIRTFDPETQRKTGELQEAKVTAVSASAGAARPPAGDSSGNGDTNGEERDPSVHVGRAPATAGGQFVESLPAGSWVVLYEPQELIEEGKHYLSRLNNPRGLFSVPAVIEACTRRPSVTIAALSGGSLETTCRLQVESIERFGGPRAEVLKELASIVGREEKVVIACHNEGERERLKELLEQSAPELAPQVRLCLGAVTRGFRLVVERVLVLSDAELFSRVDVRRVARKKKIESRALDTFLDLNEGDLVVHLAHGIGRYRGMQVIEKEGRREEHLSLEFRDNVRIWVPVSLIHLVQKYIGAAKAAPTLSKIGGTAWSKSKERVQQAVSDMASDMLRLQAQRDAMPGFPNPEDSHFQHEFEAAFPYTETPDQLTSIEAVKKDLEKPRPMDRLLCGDVGFGKTEVAMRAAFKVVDSGRQVAVLVPTTVLAEQHYRTFCERMAEFPVRVEVLSRFKSKAEQREVLKQAEEGRVDIVIGTHRLVQKDVRFKDLGLLVVDEEQRFGVEHKERLKHLRLTVDVLTMTATPIPRTLHFSLMGIRDISNLTTPPQDRVPIETRIVRWDGELIRSAIVRELNRGGQAYFVHNRVYDIYEIVDRLQNIIPEAKITVVHGQMDGDELERNMLEFVQGKANVLVATTIIESGLDIPNANTIFIDQSENYGLADMHQLRGRVGRYKHRAYCYLLLDPRKHLSAVAAKRLKTLEEYSELGAGFKIAMRDLEIRGAGNILGTEQSGHITTVGYELYCQLLENAVRGLQHLPARETKHVNIDLPLTAFVPNSYVPPGRQKIDVYRKLFSAASQEELVDVLSEMRDRFGPVPMELEQLARVRELQIHAQTWTIDKVHLEDDGRFAVFHYRKSNEIVELQKRVGRDLRIVDNDRKAYYLLPKRGIEGDELIAVLIRVLTSPPVATPVSRTPPPRRPAPPRRPV
ncbi:Transcription-repair-coupling factor [Caulifigura coniformis]|uniref:Transcription-repair-coupling factor n=1 Tax=Caulifigura coniformis TaxID=2527983 RepID=A0A517S9A2_9PLAN|nr:transcription-repair coupling factor [Caulifigura coniformis]QDT52676.1 Transcription-repair-coupling factor [Caulifigura coniformis]